MGTYVVYVYLQQTRFKCKKKKDDYFEMLGWFCGSLENITSPPAFPTGITDTALGLLSDMRVQHKRILPSPL